jgi:superfamily II DNA or RNA helicase
LISNQDAHSQSEGLSSLSIAGTYDSGQDLLKEFYIPVLEQAKRYDRVAGYFFSSSFVSAAAGISRFISGGGQMRMLVGAQLTDADRDALTGAVSLDEVLAARLQSGALSSDEVANKRLQVIAWLIREGRLQIRIGVPCDNTGAPLVGNDAYEKYFHSKFGILTDNQGGQVVFSGTINESAAGWQKNFENFSVYQSTQPIDTWNGYAQPLVDRFEELWRGTQVGDFKSVELPAAIENQLLRLIPDDQDWVPPLEEPDWPPLPKKAELTGQDIDSLNTIKQAPASKSGVGLVSSGVTAWPHQEAIARRIVNTWPRSYLLADEVGLGKTIEAGLAIRELLLSKQIETALLLVPASVLVQWQEELSEKLLLDIPRYERGALRWADGRTKAIERGANIWRSAPVLLASSHLARRKEQREVLVTGRPWDLVLLDEAHHARRKGANPTDTPNQMLATLLAMKEHEMWDGLLLASATPLQFHTHDLWDLLNIFGLNGLWAQNAQKMEQYFEELRESFKLRQWKFLRTMLLDHFNTEGVQLDVVTKERINTELGLVAGDRILNLHNTGIERASLDLISTEERVLWDAWLRANTPVRDRVFRTTRTTLRQYRATGVLPVETVIPNRHVNDEFLALGEAQGLYDRIETYIRNRHSALTAAGGKGIPLGFIMTVYRRRLTSSFYAVQRSLERRRDVLSKQKNAAELLDEDDQFSLESVTDLENIDLNMSSGDVGAEIAELDGFIRNLKEQPPDEPKMARLHEILHESFQGGHKTVVIFTQYTDTLHYLRERLRTTFGDQVACYFGGGGERWDSVTQTWKRLTKEQVKDLFRRGEEVRILIGTDSMSEGLNLQTCDRLINFDLPWNFMRVEQRIGRVDRIGGLPNISATNFFYKGTVEQDIYNRIKDRHDWFTHVVGNSQPVLAATESVIQKAALGQISGKQAAGELNDLIDQLENADLRIEDLDAVPHHENPLTPAMDLAELKEALFEIDAVKERFHEHPAIPNAWLVEIGGAKHEITFDPHTYNEEVGLAMFSWGTELFEQLLNELE